MNENDENSLSLDDAIRMAQIIAKAPEERLPLILSVFEKAGVDVDGLEQLEEWKAAKEQVCLIDIQAFMKEIKQKFGPADVEDDNLNITWIVVPNKDFTEFCAEKGLKVRHIRKALADKGLIKADVSGSRTRYTVTLRRGGKVERCVLIKEVDADVPEHQDNVE